MLHSYLAPSRRATPPEDLLAWLVVGCSLAAALRAHLTFFDPPTTVHHHDEGYITAFAQRMLDGRLLPYVDAVSHRGPLLYWTAALAVWLGGPFSWVPIRACALAAMLLTMLFAFGAGRAAGHPFAGAVAALAVMLNGVVVMGPYDGLSFNGEHLLDVFAMGALWLMVHALRAPRARPWLFASGACACLALLSKHNGAVVMLALAAWLVFACWRRRERLSWLASYLAGCALPLAVVIGIYAAAGELRALRYWSLDYNVAVYMAPFGPGEMKLAWHAWITQWGLQLSIAALLSLWGLTRPFASGGLHGYAHAFGERGFIPAVGLGALCSVVTTNSALRAFNHYYVTTVPWLGLLFGLLLETLVPARRPRAALTRSLLVAPAVGLSFVTWQWNADTHRAANASGRAWAADVCAVVEQNTPPGAPLFVWGFRPDLYTWCHRRAASRYVFTTFVAGYVPWFDRMTLADEDRLSVPGSRETLIAELEAAAVPVILDDPTSMSRRQMARYPELKRYLDEHYCYGGTRSHVAVFLRREVFAGPCLPIPPASPSLP